MTWRGSGFVDHHVHLLRVAAGELGDDRRVYEPSVSAFDRSSQEATAAFHRRIRDAGTTPMDELRAAPREGAALRSGLQRGLDAAAQLGLVEVTEAGLASWACLDALRDLREEGPLSVRVKVFVASGLASPTMIRLDDPMLDVVGVKFYADGWLGPRTCAVCTPFLDQPDDHGILFQDALTLARRIEPFALAGWSVATHAIGDRAMDAVLDAYEMVWESDCASAAPRIEHAQLLRPDLIERIADLGVVACIQPSFAVSDAPARRAALGEDWPAAYRWDLLLDGGARVIAGSDFPIETLSPLWNLQRLLTGAEIGADQVVAPTLPLDRALPLMTDGAAGVTVLEENPSEVDPARVHEIRVLEVEPAQK